MKVLASDFDGTLLFNGKFKEEDLKKVKEFQSQGHLFGLCSGRPFSGIVDFCKPYITFDFYILCTGAVVLDKDENVLFKSTISKQSLRNLFDRYEEKYEMFVQANLQIYTKNKEDLEGLPLQYVSSIEEINGDIYGISMRCKDDNDARNVCLDIIEHFKELTPHQNKEFIDVTAKGCSKGYGILKLKEYLNIDTIAGIGDSYNDMPMLEVVDHSFTFHSSPDCIKDMVDDVVDSVNEAICILEGE